MWAKFIRLSILVSLVLALSVPAAVSAQGGGPVYVVQAGDTLSGIARRFGTTVDALILENSISDPSRIFPGMELTIPGFSGISGRLTLMPFELGDTLENFSYTYDLDQNTLMLLNHIVRPDRLFAGMSLIAPVPEDTDHQNPGRHILVGRSGESALELAARGGEAMWTAVMGTGDALHLWILPGDLYAFGTREDGVNTGLPDEVRAVRLDPTPLVQGRTTEIDLDAPEATRIEGTLGNHTLAFFQSGTGEWIGLQGIHALTEPGILDFRLSFYGESADEPAYEFQQPVQLISGDYGFQLLNGVPPETVDPAVTGPEDEMIASTLAPASPEKMWQGPFELPSRYYTTEFISTFGTRRSYNNGSLMYYHTGIDFYGRDVPIYAAAAGRVVFTGSLTVRGNATYIDHGWGVYSGYLHQSEIYVQVGELVEKGQIIGKVGGTGRVTGPHLHWEIWVGDVPVQPLDWVSPGYPVTWERQK